jgi:hypothetical protein
MYNTFIIWRCTQKFPDWVDNKINSNKVNTHWEATQRIMVAKLIRMTHKLVIQLHLVAESCTICSSHSRWPVQKLLMCPHMLQTSPPPPSTKQVGVVIMI